MKKLILSLLLVFIASISNAAELQPVEAEITTPNLKLESLKGEALDLESLKGTVVLVQFWATYCTPCRVEMPSMNKLIKKLEDSKTPFKILAVNMGESKDEVQKFGFKDAFIVAFKKGEKIPLKEALQKK